MSAQPYYAWSVAVAALAHSWHRWEGTPFRARWRECKRGVDCVGLAAALLEESGAIAAIPPEDLPAYPLDWSAHNDGSMLEDWLTARAFLGCAVQVITQPSELMAGDVLVFSPGRSVHHLGIALDSQTFAHALSTGSACTCAISHPRFSGYFRRAWRILES